MRHAEILPEAIYAELTGRDGLSHCVWKNPGCAGFANVVLDAANHDGMRSLLTEDDFFFWQSIALLHDDFIKQTGIDGVKIRLGRDGVLANLETIGAAEAFPWVFAGVDVDDLDMEVRREVVERWLRANDRLRLLYGATFPIQWYS
jgi:hypothetical protein